MSLSDVQLTIVIGWGIRGLVWLLISLLCILRGDNQRSRVLLASWFLLTTSYFGSLAEYFDFGLSWVRLTEVGVAAIFVLQLVGATLKLDTPSLVGGGLSLLGFSALYTLAAVTEDEALQAGFLVIGGVIAVSSMLTLRSAIPRNWFVERVIIVMAVIFYLVVVLQTICGPWIRADWDRLAWAIIWEVAITGFYCTLAILSWFDYTVAAPECTYGSDFYDNMAYSMTTNRFAPPPAKLAD